MSYAFICNQCGCRYRRWAGRCADRCGAWGSIVPMPDTSAHGARSPNAILLDLLEACAEGDPEQAQKSALELARSCERRHAPNIVWPYDNPKWTRCDRLAFAVEYREAS